MNDIIVSIIVPIYNVSSYLSNCLNSIITQTYKNLEIILINDGSTDESLKICQEYQKKDQRIILINSENEGVAKARNKGLDIATGNYICFIDSDDYLDKNYIFFLLNEALVTNADIIACNYKRVDESGNILENKDLGKYSKTNNYEIIKDFLYGLNYTNTLWNKIFKKEIINNIRFMPYQTSEDYNFLAKVYLNVNKKVNINNYLYYYVNRSTSVCNKPFSKKTLDVIYAREDVFKLYKSLEYNYFCNVIASRILFYILEFFPK